MEMKIKQIREINQKIYTLEGYIGKNIDFINWAEDMNWATKLLEKMGEEFSIKKYQGAWHILHNNWRVSHKSLPMAICLAFIKWKEGK